MAGYEDFKKKHLWYIAKAAALDNKVGRNKKLLDEIIVFMGKLNQDKKGLKKKEAINLDIWLNRWIELTKPYR